jgi:YVTN family beta-propeller protein
MIDYLTVSVRIEALYADNYKAIVSGPGGGVGHAEFEMPFDERELEALAKIVSRPRSVRRRIESDESAQAREFGERLFEQIFKGKAHEVLSDAQSRMRQTGQGMRMRFQLENARSLRNVPWELLCDSTRFVSISAYSPVLRHVDVAGQRAPLSMQAPLRILGMVSSPGDMPELDAERERERLTGACHSLVERGLLEIEWVPEASLDGLLECLNEGDYHIFHFIGHGDFDEQAEDGVLLLEGRAGRSQRVTGKDLGVILGDQHTLRLAVINACEGARVAPDSNGVASSLMRYGLPAVIAMQFEISDEAAVVFAECFYKSVARGNPIDHALVDARKGMFAKNQGLEWATPVLLTSLDDGRLFDIGWDQLGPPPDKPPPDKQSKDRRGTGNGQPRGEQPEQGEKHGRSKVAQPVTGGSGQDKTRKRLKVARPAPWVMAASATALVVLVALVLGLSGAFSGESGPRVGHPITVWQAPVGIVAKEGQVWVTNRGRDTVSRIDLGTLAVADLVEVAGRPNSIAMDPSGHVWVVSIESGKVTVFDPPAGDRVLNTYTVGREPNTIAIGYGSAWVGNSASETVSRIPLRSALDHSSGALPQIAKVGHTSGIAVGLGAVWVADSRGVVLRIDPTGQQSVTQIPIGHEIAGVAVGSGSVWVTSPYQNLVSRIEQRAEKGEVVAKVVATIPVGEEPRGIAAAANGIWVANKRSGSVSWITPGADERKPREILLEKESEPNAIAIDPHLGRPVWVTRLDDNTVTPIEP